ncbi:hypothetical protein F2P81_017316 [Scophthalmus maximus]|uniref:EGF-like domain-containing protein n=1 Tax=Scophthalmus maximus TaxID=52904 RepID=A0A6A4SDL5_SCOMX|nr:hypothetical protein F2P81_017316 [Scophthalmus maximus]
MSIRMRTSACTQTVRRVTSPLLLLLLLLLSSSSSSSSGSSRGGAAPAPFQLAPDTPAPAEPTPTQSTPRPHPCEGRPCLNGGFCLALSSARRPEDTWEYTCTCSQGFTGRNCEVTESLHCVSPELCELTAGTLTLTLEVPEETAVKVVVNASGAPVLWRLSEEGFLRSSILNGTAAWFLQAPDGLVVPDHLLPLGQNYFLSVMHVGAPTAPEVTLRLNLSVKASSCVEPGSSFSDPQCSGKGKCITQPSETMCRCAQTVGKGKEKVTVDLVTQRNSSDKRQRERQRRFISYQGATCEQKVDPCASGPCHNNGTCYAQGPGPLGFGCSCTAGFTGPTCAQLVDFCALNPCAHGVCRSVGNSYRCLCVPGYHGLYCEEEYNECLSAPCQNYATCRDLINAYECVCTPQFEGEKCEVDINECESNPCHHGGTCVDQSNGFTCHCQPGWVGPCCEIHLQWKPAHTEETLTNMPRHSLYIIIGALCVAFVLMLIILIVGICRISRIEYQGSSRHAYQEFYNCRSIDSEFSNAIASIRHARFGKKPRPAMYDATPIAYEDYSPDDKPLVTLIKTKDL